MRALDLRVRALAPAAKPRDFVLDEVLQRLLAFALGVEKFFLLFQKRGVAAAGAQEAVRIDAAQFDHLVGDVLEEVAVMADDDGGERCVLQQLLQPCDASEVEMVGRLVEQQNVGLLYQRFGDGQTLPPAAGECRRFLLEVFEAGAAECFAGAGLPFGFRDAAGTLQRGVNHFANRLAGREL